MTLYLLGGSGKMKIIKTIFSIMLCTAVLVTTGFAFYNNHTQNQSGRYSSVTVITDNEREWILERFGHKYETVEELISTVQNYARKNFKYDHGKFPFLQHYDFSDIEKKGDKINGICFDFSVLFKNITLVLDEEGLLPIDNIKVYVADIQYPEFFKPRHSYNILSLPNGNNYYLDLTMSVSRVEKGLLPIEDYEIFTGSIKNYCARYNEKLINLH